MERGWAKREREHEARGDMSGRKREKQEEVKGRRGRGQRKKKRGEEEREEERETTRTNLELPMDVAADRHRAPHRRDVGLGGEDLAPIKARILLMLALTKTRDGADIQRMFLEY